MCFAWPRRLREICNRDDAWQSLFQERWPACISQTSAPPLGWKSCYASKHTLESNWGAKRFHTRALDCGGGGCANPSCQTSIWIPVGGKRAPKQHVLLRERESKPSSSFPVSAGGLQLILAWRVKRAGTELCLRFCAACCLDDIVS